MDLKKFEGAHQRLEDRITITGSYSIGFPSKFYKDNGISNFNYAILFFAEDERAIGIHFSNDETDKNKFRIIKSKQDYGGSIVSRSFFKANRIEPQKYRGRYEWENYDLAGVGQVYLIRLKEREKGPLTSSDP